MMAQLGDPFVHTFPPSAYQSDAYVSSPQNWGIIQDNRGIMYVSNTSGVLEHDGYSWQLVGGTGYNGRFKVAKNSEGKIYVGSKDNLGYLAPDTTGKMQFVSLLPYLKNKYPEVNVNSIAALGRDIYFNTENNLFLWSGNKFNVWENKAGITRIFPSQNKLYAIDKEKGLSVLENGGFKALPGGESLKNLEVTALLPLPPTTDSNLNFFVVTHENGLYSYKNQALKKLDAKPAKVLDDERFMHGLTLADGNIALATVSNGVVIMSHDGQVINFIDQENGLGDNAVISLYIDKEGGLWAALNKGISRINYPSPVTYLDETSGLDGIVLEILKKDQFLYAGTASGLYILNEKDVLPTFQKLPQLQREVWKMLDLGNSILILNPLGVYELKGKNLERISPPTENIEYKTVYRSGNNQNKFYIGTTKGLFVMTHQRGKWSGKGKLKM
ncbi:hypothetical protein ACFS7Z_03625 [Pontibacter toksunensis]|uniref:Two component regulator propeller n=1 Tax=Pontibacter toksunensis TaxID=1332631 RepID=A0ABW6BRL3_9BACT